MTVHTEVRLTGNTHHTFIPGEDLRGDVLVTTSKPIKVRSIYVELHGMLWANTHSFAGLSQPGVNLIPQNHHPANSLSLEFGIGEMRQQHNANHNINNEPRKLIMTLAAFKYTLSGETQWSPGQHHVPFNLSIPFQKFVPPIKDNRIRVEYWLQAFVDSPMPLVSSLSTSKKSQNLSLQLAERFSAEQMLAGLSPKSKWASISLGEWDKTSSKAGALFKYAIGRDTARKWYELVADFRVAQQIPMQIGSSIYLSELIGLILTPQSDLGADILVRHLKIRLITQVRVRHSETRGALVFGTDVLDVKDPSFVISKGSPANVPVDLSSLASAAQLPNSVFPSIDCYPLLVTHELVVNLKLKADPRNGVRQKSSSVEILIPVHIVRNFFKP